MRGLILADVNVVRMMDKKLDTGYSNVVPAYIDSKEAVSQSKSSAITKEQFKDLQNYTNKLIKEIAKEILSGNIDIKPSYNTKKKKTPCEYCEYRSICNFDSKNNEYNYIENLEKQVILEKIQKL